MLQVFGRSFLRRARKRPPDPDRACLRVEALEGRDVPSTLLETSALLTPTASQVLAPIAYPAPDVPDGKGGHDKGHGHGKGDHGEEGDVAQIVNIPAVSGSLPANLTSAVPGSLPAVNPLPLPGVGGGKGLLTDPILSPVLQTTTGAVSAVGNALGQVVGSVGAVGNALGQTAGSVLGGITNSVLPSLGLAGGSQLVSNLTNTLSPLAPNLATTRVDFSGLLFVENVTASRALSVQASILVTSTNTDVFGVISPTPRPEPLPALGTQAGHGHAPPPSAHMLPIPASQFPAVRVLDSDEQAEADAREDGSEDADTTTDQQYVPQPKPRPIEEPPNVDDLGVPSVGWQAPEFLEPRAEVAVSAADAEPESTLTRDAAFVMAASVGVFNGWVIDGREGRGGRQRGGKKSR